MNGAIAYYQTFFTSQGTRHYEDILSIIPPLLSDEENLNLLRIPDEEEITSTILTMSGDSAPGPDGFPGLFFTHCWSIVKDDVIAAVLELFQGGNLQKYYTSYFLVMIPKMEQPSTMSDFRPISLCHFIYKIIARIFYDHFATILPMIISPNQGAFVKGRSIFENMGCRPGNVS